MHQTKKGNQMYFGTRGHVGVDSKAKLMHSVVATPANVHESQVLEGLLQGDETCVWGNSAYSGRRERLRARAPAALGFTNPKGHRYRKLSDEERARSRTKSTVRAKCEHPLPVIRRTFGFDRVRYRGMAKNANRLFVTCALANLAIVRRQLLGQT